MKRDWCFSSIKWNSSKNCKINQVDKRYRIFNSDFDLDIDIDTNAEIKIFEKKEKMKSLKIKKFILS